jgi:hypothetical protein
MVQVRCAEMSRYVLTLVKSGKLGPYTLISNMIYINHTPVGNAVCVVYDWYLLIAVFI